VELQKSLPDFERHHIVPFAISYDAVDVLATFAAKQHITYTLLSDEGSTVIRASVSTTSMSLSTMPLTASPNATSIGAYPIRACSCSMSRVM
jgi:peroxiredoxin